MKLLPILSLALLLAACGSRYKFWHISQFHLQPLSLKDGEEIKLIYFSQGPDDNVDLDYFFHVIAVSQRTGDTVNILTTANPGIAADEGDRVFNFISQENDMAKLVHAELDNITHVKDLEQLKPVDLRSITKVARDPAFDELADNKHPTVIGWVGTVGNVNP